MFAEDTNITTSGKYINEVENAVNSNLESPRKLLMANKLSLSVAKTEFQLTGTKQNLKNVLDRNHHNHILDSSIKQCKTLDVTLNENLSFKSNTEAT